MDNLTIQTLSKDKQILLDVTYLQERAIGRQCHIKLRRKKKGVTQTLTIQVSNVDISGVSYIDTDGIETTIPFDVILKICPVE